MTLPRYKPLRARVGRHRVPAADIFSEGNYTRAVREEMRAIENEFARFTKFIETVSPDILFETLEPTFKKSQEYCPVKTEALKMSGYLEKRKFRGNVVVEVGYAKGGKPPYAPIVHERIDYYHAPPTRAKFLQAALEEDAAEIQDRIVTLYEDVTGLKAGV